MQRGHHGHIGCCVGNPAGEAVESVMVEAVAADATNKFNIRGVALMSNRGRRMTAEAVHGGVVEWRAPQN
jgi:hypothetical protein